MPPTIPPPTTKPPGNTSTTSTTTSTGGGGGGSTAGDWGKLSAHDRASYIGNYNDAALQTLGRRVSDSEAKMFYAKGWGTYAVQQYLIHHHIKQWYNSTAPNGGRNMVNLANTALYENLGIAQGTVKFKASQLAKFAASGWSPTDIANWALKQPKIFVHSTQYATNLTGMQNAYAQAFGLQNVDPSQWSTSSTRVHVDTNKKKKGVQGQVYKTVTGAPGSGDPLSAHIQSAALHFQSPDQYVTWLQKQPSYKQYQAETMSAGQANQVQGQGPEQQQPLGQRQQADVGA